jgi:uncharacterized protein
MSAANAKVQEPSMEEILASIRRIISDDQSAKAAAEEAAANAAVAEPEPDPTFDELDLSEDDMVHTQMGADDDDILDLTEAAPAETQNHAVDNEAVDIDFRDFSEIEEATAYVEPVRPAYAPEPVYTREPEPHYEPRPEPVSRMQPAPSMRDDRLMSPMTDANVASAFGSLANTILANNARTLDDLVSEMLRPMLKVWLDDNLPTIVERLVRAEIERVARTGRSS